MKGEKNMFNVFEKKRANEIEVQLSDGRRVILEDLIKEYESLSKEKNIIKLKVAEWFLINREVINKNKKESVVSAMRQGLKGKHFGRDLKSQIKLQMKIQRTIHI